MIRYRLPTVQLDGVAAVRCQHPALARLAGCGPWSTSINPAGTTITKGTAATWGEWKKRGDLEYSLAYPMPPFDLATFQKPHPVGETVRLACGVTVVVKPAAYDQALTLDDEPGEPVSDYGRLAESVFLRIQESDIPYTDSEMRALCFAALRSNTTLTDELIVAYRLIAISDIDALVSAAAGLPKAAAGSGGSSAALPASTPAA